MAEVIKSSGQKARFSVSKLRNSLKYSGADENTIKWITEKVHDELYPGISTKEIYNRAYALLKKKKSVFASKYKLKKAIYELGPTGFPFERFVAALLQYSGFKVKVSQIISGGCVSHEIDVLAIKNEKITLIECKFHNEEGRNCDVKVPLYIHSRFQDILSKTSDDKVESKYAQLGWVVTNTRFSKDAQMYGSCVGLYLLSWDFPKGNSLKERIDRLQLYPITVSTILTSREKEFLLSRDIVLCKQLIHDTFYLGHLGLSPNRKIRILNEIKSLCQT